MNINNNIGWCTATWNPLTGCTPISEGCQNCWAKRMATRLRGRCGYPKDDAFKVTFHPDRLDEPSHYRKPQRIFVSSMGDLFHDEVTDDQIFRVFSQWSQGNRRHALLILTKRPTRMKKWFDDYAHKFWNYHAPGQPKKPYVTPSWPDERLWLGVTAENQARADERIPILLSIPAAVHFVSVEPMLEDINLEPYLLSDYDKASHENQLLEPLEGFNFRKISWVIAGPENGSGKRPCKPEWIENLHEQCKAAGVPFWDKREEFIERKLPV